MSKYVLLDSKTMVSDTATVSFTGIPSTYTDLVVFVMARNSQNNYGGFGMYFNNTNANLAYRYSRGYDASSHQSGTRTDNIDIMQYPTFGDASGVFANIEIYIKNYASTTQTKYFRADSGRVFPASGGSNTSIRMANGTWNDQTAINRVDLGITDYFLTGSKFWLYGI